jgi:NAD(P)-dependent dehydrogenase (short-subunit alcohol dehydrogenase family)
MKKVILITGISSGFGKQTAINMALKGHIVYGTVRKESEEYPNIHILRMDLTDHSSIKIAVNDVLQKEGRLDILINNAGMHTGGPVETSPLEHIRLQMETNFLGMVQIIREVLPAMRNQGGGTIINISSIGGLMGLPFQAFYSASKFAIEGFCEALRMELKQFNIKVVLINPGDFHTNNTINRRNYLAPAGETDPYSLQFQKTLSIIENDEKGGWPPEILALKLCRIIESNNPHQRYVIASFEQKLAVILKKILPGSLFRKLLEDHYRIK